MCGRFNLFTNPRLFAEVFAVARTFDDDWDPAYNIAPTQKVLCIRDAGEREFFKAKWGLIPSWAKDAKIGASCINARVETVDTKPAFRSAFKKRRCLVMADVFYEWRKSDKQPHFISLKSGEQMAFAGLWETWKSPEGPVDSCTICTTDAHDMMGQLHDRMPFILPELKPLLRQFPGEEMQSWAVGKAVGNVRNQGPSMMEPIAAPEELKFE